MSIRIFSYGSNGTAQLRARVLNAQLMARPARLDNYVRVFCLNSEGWGNCGVASLAPSPGGVTLGSVVELTPEEKARLDKFEGGYREERIQVLAGDTQCAAIAYIAGIHSLPYTPALELPPSEQYLVAIHAHLREYWSMGDETITIRSHLANGSCQTHSEWKHPGCPGLSLAAFCVETPR